ncbi:MAG: GAF and ANTAR domain-containing protein [Pedococcus sp.]
MSPRIPSETSEAFASLAELVYSGADSQKVLDSICRLAVDLIPGADHVSISTLSADLTLVSVAASDDVARLMDRLETEAGEGPCLDSIVESSFQRDSDIRANSTWPTLAALTLDRTPVRGMVGYQLKDGAHGRAALDVFSDTPGALTDEAADIGTVLAAFTSVALAAAERQSDIVNLRRGMESNREIGKAVGLLMAAHSVTAEEAFDILRSASSRTNTKLAAIAQKIAANYGQNAV